MPESHNTPVYKPQGGNRLVVADGGEIVAQDGAVIRVGGEITLTVAGDNLIIDGLPDSDPQIDGALFTDSDVLTISSGN